MALVRLNKDSIYYEFDPVNPANHLGTGGMGVVFKGSRIDTESGRVDSVAIKVLFKDLPEESIDRARREASIQIEHENVIRMYGCVDVVDAEKKVTCHVISEYLDGDTLDKRSDNGEVFDESEAIKIVKSILSGLYMIHDKGYIHRDIDPSNVMMCKSGKIKLIDFGIAKNTTAANVDEGQETLKKGTQVGKFIGKVFYASPEQAQGLHGDTDRRSDVYSVGVLLYQLLTGRVPFDGNTIYEIIKQHIENPIVFDDTVNVNLQHIISKATAKMKEDRYQSVSEFIVDLEKHENGIPIPPPQITGAQNRRGESSKAWIFITIALLLMLFIGGGVGYLYHGQSQAIKIAQNLVKSGEYEGALRQYEEGTKYYAPQLVLNEVNLLKEAREVISRYNFINPGDLLLESDLKSISDRGFADGYYYSAELSFDGIMTAQDQDLAIENLKQGVHKGSILSNYRLGVAYLNGEGVEVDKTKAYECLSNVKELFESRNIDKLSPEMLYVYGKMCSYGYYLQEDQAKAKELLTMATKANHSGAYYELYLMQLKNNDNDTVDYLTKAVELGYTKAEYDLAVSKIASSDYKEAVELLNRTVAKRYALAGEQLAFAYYRIAQSNRRNKLEYTKYMNLAIESKNGDEKWSRELQSYLNPRPVVVAPKVETVEEAVEKPVEEAVEKPVNKMPVAEKRGSWEEVNKVK